MTRRTFAVLGALASIPEHLALAAQELESHPEIIGKLDDELAPEFSMSWSVAFSRRTEHRSADLDFAIPEDAQIYEGNLKFIDDRKPISVRLIESASEGAYLFADVDRDGRFARSEALKFQKVIQRPNAIGDVVVRVPLAAGPFRYFPIRVRLFPNESEPGGPSPAGTRTVFYSYLVYVTASIEVEGKPLKVWCEYNLQTGLADPTNGFIGMDLDGDGQLAPAPSPERARPKNEEIVFRVGASYLSIHQVNIANRTMVLLLHPRTDYLRVELGSGALFPDFEFTDFEGRKHRLSDIAAKYLLLDFWGSWCGPCLGEFPTLIRAYQQFRPRGFEILGIDCDEPHLTASKCIAKYKLPWAQATSESTSDFVHKGLNLFSFPTLILLDSNRRIVLLGLDSRKLRGEALLSTLKSVLPESF